MGVLQQSVRNGMDGMASGRDMMGSDVMVAPPKVQPAPNDQAADAPGADMGGNLGGDLQGTVDKVVESAKQLLYSDGTRDTMLKRLTQSSVDDAVPALVVMLVRSVDAKLNDALPDESLMPAAVNILEDVVDFYEKATKKKIDDGTLQKIANSTVRKLAEEYGTTPDMAQEFIGSMSPEDMNSTLQGLGDGQA